MNPFRLILGRDHALVVNTRQALFSLFATIEAEYRLGDSKVWARKSIARDPAKSLSAVEKMGGLKEDVIAHHSDQHDIMYGSCT